MTVSAAIFGFDGTLVDSHEAHFLARRQTLGELGLTLDQAWYDAHAGASFDEAVAMLAAEQQVVVTTPFQEIDNRCSAAYLEHLDRVKPIHWVKQLVESFSGHLPLALASGASADTVLPTMKATGLDGIFSAVITREDVSRGKPSPELFLTAARRLAVPATECLVFDYSAEGIEAAHRAQMPVVNVRGR
ncbi:MULTISPECIES: HAD family hydrolase [unclassified Kitasatospora]